MLSSKVAFVTGVASKHSIAAAVATAWYRAGATIVLGVQSERFQQPAGAVLAAAGVPEADRHVVVCDVASDASVADAMSSVSAIGDGRVDAVLHSVAYASASAMKGDFVDTARADFAQAMDISAYSLVALAHASLPLFQAAQGGSITALSYLGAQRVVPNYNVMGPAKAALESCSQYLAASLGEHRVRVNTISAGPLNTLAARGIQGFTTMQAGAADKAPLPDALRTDDVAAMATFLASDAAKAVTGQTMFVDNGFSALA